MARYQPSSKRSRKRILLPGQALSFALGSRARDHRDSMVGAVVLRPQAITRGTPRWNTLGREHDAARSTRGSLPKKGWSRTSTPCTRSARCEAFIKSQTGEGWRLIKTAYDDGGLSG